MSKQHAVNSGRVGPGNQLAKKRPADKASGIVQMRVKMSDKSKWVRRAQRENMGLTAWIIAKLNAE